MANEFVVQNGLLSLDSSTISGSLTVTGPVTAQSFTGSFTGSFAGTHTGTFPYTSLTGVPAGILSSSTQINALSGVSASFATTASAATSITFVPTTASFASTAPYSGLTNVPIGIVSASSQINHNTTTNYIANEHVNHTSVSITAGNGLSGGGDISTSKTLTLDTGSTHFTGGVTTAINARGVISSSGQVSYIGLSNIPVGIVSSSAQVTNLLPTGTVSSSTQINNYNVFATTGSNAFNANQTITGSLIITQNLTVLGSSSVSFVSQSTLNIGTNLITVNVQNPSVRFGGLAVIDSGSSPQRSGSLFFDSTNDQWIFVHQNVAGGVTSSILVMGPPTFNNVGNETLLTQNRVLKGGGLEHIVDSQITDDGSIVSITNALNVGTSVTASAANITTLRSTTVSASGGISGSGLFVTNDVVGNNFRSATTSYYFNPTTGLFNILNGYIGAIYSPGSVLRVSFSDAASTFSGNVIATSITSSVSGALAGTFPYASLTGIPIGIVSSSGQISYTGLTNIPIGIISSSTQINALSGVSASFATIANQLNGGTTGYIPVWSSATAQSSSALFQSASNVGINTTSPGARFVVNGTTWINQASDYGGPTSTVQISAGSSADNVIVRTNSLYLYSYGNTFQTLLRFGNGGETWNIGTTTGSAPDFRLYELNGALTRVTVQNGGNVGIGTSLPTSRLHVGGNSAQINIGVLNSSTGNATLQFYSGNSGTFNGFALQYLKDTGIDRMAFIAGGSTEVVSMLTSRNVGIGTISPDANLTVQGQASFNSGSVTNPGVAARGDLNTGMYFPSADTIGFVNGGVEAMRIDSSGRVGIGTVNPASNLHVSSSNNTTAAIIDVGVRARYQYQANSTSLYTTTFNMTDTGLSIGHDSGIRDFQFVTGNSTRMTILGGGNVGIGTTSPSALLHVSASGTTNDLIIGTAATPKLFVSGSGFIGINRTTAYVDSNDRFVVDGGRLSVNAGAYQAASFNRSNNGNITEFLIGNSGRGAIAFDGTNFNVTSFSGMNFLVNTSTNAVFISGSGNVGIGMTNPTSRLQVAGDFRFGSNTAYTDLRLFTDSPLSGYNQTNAITPTTIPGSGTAIAGLYLKNAISGTGTTRIDLLVDGNVGIGTTSPDANLTVFGQASFNSGSLSNPGVAARGDLNTGMYFPSADTIGFVEGGVEAMRIDSSGNVGIGTTSPSALLHVSASGTTNDFLVGTNKLFVSASGNVGIGTTSPSERLRVNGTFASNALWTNSNAVTFWGSYDSPFGALTWDTGFARVYAVGSNRLDLSAGGTTPHLSIISGGNVGIGTTVPGATLHVQGAISSSTIRTSTSGNVLANSFTAGFASGARVIDSTSPAFELWHDGSSVGQFLFSSNALRYGVHSGNGVLTERLRIDSSGNVGIGATSLNSLLHLRSASPVLRIDSTNPANNSELKLTYNNDDNHGLLLRYNGNSAVSFIDNTYPATVSQQYGDIQFRQNVSSSLSARMIIKADGGNVGIGTTTPGARLDVVNTAGAVTSRVRSTFSNAYFIIDRQDTSSEGFLRFATNTSNIWTLGLKDNTNTLYFNNGTDRVAINSSGNVGIGTTAPGTTLHVQGNISASFITGSAIYVSSSLGELLSQTSSSMAVGDIFYDTNITVSSLSSDGPSVYELLAQYNPNLSGSSTYRNILHGHIYIEQGWDGSQLVMSAEYNELYRAIASGSSDGSGANVNVSFVSASGAATAIESITVPFASSSWRMRIRFSNNSVPSAFPSYRYVRLMRKL